MKKAFPVFIILSVIAVGLILFSEFHEARMLAYHTTEQASHAPSDTAALPSADLATNAPTPAAPTLQPFLGAAMPHRTINETHGTRQVTLHCPMTGEPNVDAQIEAFLRAHANAFVSSTADGFMDARFETRTYNEYIAGFVFALHTYSTADGLMTAYEPLMFDMVGGHPVNLDALFAPDYDYRTVSAAAIQGQLDAAIHASAETAEAREAFTDALRSITDANSGDYSAFTFDMGVLTFFFRMPTFGTTVSAGVPLSVFGDNWCIDQYTMQYAGGQDDPPIVDDPPVDTKYIALTFDDGPSLAATTRLLDGLKEYGARATFFVLGHRLDTAVNLLARMVDEGHSIGSHTYNHKDLTAISTADIAYQLDTTNDLIRTYTGQETILLRPPYGNRNLQTADMARERGMSLILWSIDPQDWKTKDAKLISEHIISRAADGEIILLHDIYETSIDAALIVVRELTAQGYQFVTVEELIQMNTTLDAGAAYRNGRSATK